MKIYPFGLIYGAFFLENLCLYLYLSQNQTLSPFFRDIYEIVAIYLRDTASQLWRLHVLKVELKSNKVHRQGLIILPKNLKHNRKGAGADKL